MENNTKNLFETMADMQKQAVENFNNAAENMQKNMFQNNTIDSDFFKKWYDSQMSFFNQNADAKNNNPVEFFNTWMNNQMNMAKTWFENSQNMMKNMNNMNNMNDDAKKAYENMMSMYNNWMSTMNNTYSEMLKNFSNDGTAKDSFAGLFNNAEMYMKSFEFWMPMFKSMQEKTFTPETFKQMFNAPLFKDMMDKMFNMQPDFMKNMSEEAKANFFKMMDSNKGMFDQYKAGMMSNMHNMNEMFNTAYTNYNNMHSQISNALAPFMKLMTPGTQKQSAEMMNELANEFSIFNIKNAQMQYMMYVTGMKAMEEVSENIYAKIRNGEEVNSFMTIYQEWLNINDKNFVKLFESAEYSKMQAELNSFGMKLKRQIDLQMEKTMSTLPLINRSEMDELYKTIHELKKRIAMLEKQIDAEEIVAEAKPAAKKSAKNA
jgi:polyhydroxyalkanoate synthesis regulator phasin